MNIKELIKQMSLEEKASLCSGLNFWNTKPIERLNIPSIIMTDGPHGLRKQSEGADHLGINESVEATCFPTASALACSFDRDLVKELGIAIGEECQSENVSIVLGPGANIKRSPLCGRNFEYYSEDPYLSSEMAKNQIQGTQSQGIGTSLKHFAANNQEHRRMTIDTIVDERTLREIYLASFETAVKEAQPWTVMCAYNKLNGEYCSENYRLLTEILRNEWGFEGFVVSDWGAVNDRDKGLSSGLELQMPADGGMGDNLIVEAVKRNRLSEGVLDEAVERILNIIFKAVENKGENVIYSKEKHHELARKIAGECMVLLKNEEKILPLKKEENIAVIGELATKVRYQGGGSSHINPTKVDNAYEEIVNFAGPENVRYARGYDLSIDDTIYDLAEEAKKLAIEADKVILFIGLPERYESEGFDRTHLNIPKNQYNLVKTLKSVNENIVVILSNGSPIEMPFVSDVKAILEAYLTGQASGKAICDLLYGEVNPSGKLAETFPLKLSDNPSYLNFPGEVDKVEYKEGIFVGYRYYDKKAMDVLFPFGYGLSYTNFEYSNLKISKNEIDDTEKVTVSVNIKNIGDVFGKEIVQLYIRDKESSVTRPEKELKGFEKIGLEPGEEKEVTFILNKRSFAYYNVDLGDWHVESGEFEILIGKSSREIVLKEVITVNTTSPIKTIVTKNTALGDIAHLPEVQQIINAMIQSFGGDTSGLGEGNMFEEMMKFMPLRALATFNPDGGQQLVDRIIESINS
ncbi:glycoside hydrolase family 3 C-terminal domain-containing protein [Paraclostridium bifermentans]|uniref:glycoside hydrolase family 3 C-terminal domain-containing protein n=1 Tax=Paraclostridium TaxID=1849822 RepID=UPI001CC59863|nr:MULTISPECIES: glycoside hydrolase family 3 C-terminal domain-containing protein [Paraclostridium]MBZ6004358.1 glycoside hydrolase family 3 C-terminal domain-containing protein [Paraclostridium bifermentans]MDU0298015.1 glycoside hydrolase family 3 C-terminal domain-containing protein [Paraclostridium sp. MRS3W1]